MTWIFKIHLQVDSPVVEAVSESADVADSKNEKQNEMNLTLLMYFHGNQSKAPQSKVPQS